MNDFMQISISALLAKVDREAPPEKGKGLFQYTDEKWVQHPDPSDLHPDKVICCSYLTNTLGIIAFLFPEEGRYIEAWRVAVGAWALTEPVPILGTSIFDAFKSTLARMSTLSDHADSGEDLLKLVLYDEYHNKLTYDEDVVLPVGACKYTGEPID